ncbi:MAG TPA: TlpA disulfide reductase family protein [Candidatus Cybelea sp.]|nr:TlpA disulfide reductase family protein [Candidatus Cybelea sp.]
MARSVILGTAAAAGLVILSLSCAPGDVRAQTSASKTTPATHKSAGSTPPLIDVEGYDRILAKYRGKPLLVTFWATWCEPCRYEFPMIVGLAKQYAPQGLEVFGVSLDDDADMHLVRHFLEKNQPPFPNYRQKPGIDVDAFYRGVNPDWTGTMPETIFYNRDGRIAGHFIGGQPRDAFEQAIRMILSSGTSGASH